MRKDNKVEMGSKATAGQLSGIPIDTPKRTNRKQENSRKQTLQPLVFKTSLIPSPKVSSTAPKNSQQTAKIYSAEYNSTHRNSIVTRNRHRSTNPDTSKLLVPVIPVGPPPFLVPPPPSAWISFYKFANNQISE